MKTFQFYICMLFTGAVTSQTIDSNFPPSAKWAFAQSYSWAISNNGNNFEQFTQPPETMKQKSMQNAAIQQRQQAIQQQQEIQQQQVIQQQKEAIQQQKALQQLQALQQQQAFQQQQQTMRQQQELQALHLQRQQQAERLRLQSELDGLNRQLPPNIDYTKPREPLEGVGDQPDTVLTSPNVNQEFIDDIVHKVVQKKRGGEFSQSTTREDVEKIVRKVLFENSPDNRMNEWPNGYVPNQNYRSTNVNGNSLSESLSPRNSRPVTNYPNPVNTNGDCIVNCGYSNRGSQPIAVAAANSFYPLNRLTDPRMMAANSFSYTSV